jgi:hypothetical protein
VIYVELVLGSTGDYRRGLFGLSESEMRQGGTEIQSNPTRGARDAKTAKSTKTAKSKTKFALAHRHTLRTNPTIHTSELADKAKSRFIVISTPVVTYSSKHTVLSGSKIRVQCAWLCISIISDCLA